MLKLSTASLALMVKDITRDEIQFELLGVLLAFVLCEVANDIIKAKYRC